MARRRRKYREPEAAELSIDGLSHEGRGLALRDGKRVFIEGALPGEQVKALITSKRTRYEEGKVEEVLSASPQRVTPRCEHAAICGGCSLQLDGQLRRGGIRCAAVVRPAGKCRDRGYYL